MFSRCSYDCCDGRALFVAAPQLPNQISEEWRFRHYSSSIISDFLAAIFSQSANPGPFVHLWRIPLCAMPIAGISPETDEEILNFSECRELFSALAFLTLVFSGRDGSTLLVWTRSFSHVYYLVSTRLFSFTFGAILLVTFTMEIKYQLVSQVQLFRMYWASCLGALGMDVYNLQWNVLEVYYMIMFISSFVCFCYSGLRFVWNRGSFTSSAFKGLLSFEPQLFYPIHLIAPTCSYAKLMNSGYLLGFTLCWFSWWQKYVSTLERDRLLVSSTERCVLT